MTAKFSTVRRLTAAVGRFLGRSPRQDPMDQFAEMQRRAAIEDVEVLCSGLFGNGCTRENCYERGDDRVIARNHPVRQDVLQLMPFCLAHGDPTEKDWASPYIVESPSSRLPSADPLTVV